jgi:hypothetical protein
MPCDEWAFFATAHGFLQNIFSGFCLSGQWKGRLPKGPERACPRRSTPEAKKYGEMGMDVPVISTRLPKLKPQMTRMTRINKNLEAKQAG